jgi:hypothetical protein
MQYNKYLMNKYQKLNYVYDIDNVLAEIFAQSSKFITIFPKKETLKQRPFSIVPDEMYEHVDAIEADGKLVLGEISAWRGFNFTHIPGDVSSSIGLNKDRLTKENWLWKPDVECPYLKKIVKDLGFISIQNIRAMIIQPGGFGPVHRDIALNNNYYQKHTSVTLNIEDGGQPLAALIDGKMYELNDPCFVFEDDCWHGVGIVSSRRTQLRINGVVDYSIFTTHL